MRSTCATSAVAQVLWRLQRRAMREGVVCVASQGAYVSPRRNFEKYMTRDQARKRIIKEVETAMTPWMVLECPLCGGNTSSDRCDFCEERGKVLKRRGKDEWTTLSGRRLPTKNASFK